MTAVKSGVYELRNTVTGHCYIGSSVNMQNRKNDHFYHLRTQTHHSPSLQNAYNKYGKDAFEFLVLEEVPDVSQLIQREQHWIDTKHPKYNWNPTAGSRLGSKQPEQAKAKLRAYNGTPEAKERARRSLAIGWTLPSDQKYKRTGQKNSPEHNHKIAEAHTGMKHTPESLEKMRQAKLGKKQSPEAIEKRAASLRGHKHSQERIDKVAASNRAAWAKKTPEEKHRIAMNRPPVSDETRRRLSEAHKGQQWTPEAQAKRDATWANKPEEEKAAISAKRKATWEAKRLQKRVDQSNIVE